MFRFVLSPYFGLFITLVEVTYSSTFVALYFFVNCNLTFRFLLLMSDMHLVVQSLYLCSLNGGLWYHHPYPVEVVGDCCFWVLIRAPTVFLSSAFFLGWPVWCLLLHTSVVSFLFKTFQIIVLVMTSVCAMPLTDSTYPPPPQPPFTITVLVAAACLSPIFSKQYPRALTTEFLLYYFQSRLSTKTRKRL